MRSPAVSLAMIALLASVLAGCASTSPESRPGATEPGAGEPAAQPLRGLIAAKGIGAAAPGTKGRDAEATAFLAATVSALAVLARKLADLRVTGAQWDVTEIPEREGTLGHLRVTLPGKLNVTEDAWVANTFLHGMLQSLQIPGVMAGGRPLTLTSSHLVLIWPPITMVDAKEIRAAIERSGYAITAKPGSSDTVEVTVAVPRWVAVGEWPGPSDPIVPACPGAATGVIVDARGLNVSPALDPKIVAVDGQEVYGFSVAEREWAMRQGLAGYSRELDTIRAHPRIGGNPLVLKAVGVTGRNAKDAVLSEEDARKLMDANRCPRFLEKARVFFVIDVRRPDKESSPSAPPTPRWWER